MIDMNFEDDLNYILDTVPKGSRRLNAVIKYPMHMTMFSATMPIAVERLAKTYLMKPATIQIGQTGTVADQIEQRIQMVTEGEKTRLISEILIQGERFNPPVIIFCQSKKTVDYLTKGWNHLDWKLFPSTVEKVKINVRLQLACLDQVRKIT